MANLEAFQVVLEDIKQQKCTHFACLGDVVGYNANPKQCLDIVRGMNIPVVKGKPRRILLDRRAAGWVQSCRGGSGQLDAQTLTPEDRQWLRDLKYVRMVTSFTTVHATLDGPQRWGYVFDKLAAAASFYLSEHGGLFLRPTRTSRWLSFATAWCEAGRIRNSRLSRVRNIL